MIRPRLGAVIRYYDDAPPSAETVAIIEARGDTVELIPRPEPPVPPASPTWEEFYPKDLPECSFTDAACAQRRVDAVVAAQEAFLAAKQTYHEDLREYDQAVSAAATPQPEATQGSAPAATSAPGQHTPPAETAPGGFSLSSLPWYVWAGGAALLLFAFGGRR